MTSTQLQIVGQTTILNKTVNVFGTFEEPLFLAKEVAEWIEYDSSSINKMVNLVDENEKVRNIIPTPGGNQEVWMLTEDGLYEILMQSRKPIAKAFKSQVKSYLKELRTKGITATPAAIEAMLLDPDMLINALTQLKNEREKNRLLESCNLDNVKKLQEQKPKVLFADAVATSNRSCLVAELAKIINQNGVPMGQNRLFIWMRKHGYLGSKGEYYNQPTQKAMDMGLFEIKKTAIAHSDGHVTVNVTSKVTGKGQLYFVGKFLQVNENPSTQMP